MRRRRSHRVRARGLVALVAVALSIPADSAAAQADPPNVLIYSGTTGYRHSGPGEAIQPEVVSLIQSKLAAAGIESDYRSCNGEGTGGGALPGCRNPTEGNPAIFTAENLAQYDAIFFWQASSQFRNQPETGPLFTSGEQEVIEDFAQGGGGIAAMHASVTMGAGAVTWPWWDAPGDSAIGALMPGHSATDINNVATVQVSDRNHPSTRELPDEYELGDEHYTFSSNPRGSHHILATLDEESYDVGSGVTSMGADHPIAWCRMYEGARIWSSSFGHFAATYLESGGDNNLIKHLVGGVEWVAGDAGRDSDCGATVWSNFTRTVLETDLQGAIGLDVAEDGKVYWTEIGVQGIDSEGRLRMWDPDTGESTTLLAIPTRADYQSSNAGVLGMALDPDFETNRRLYVYYSPRVPASASNCDPPQANCVADDSYIPWHNVVSRFTLDAEGAEVVPGSEQEILRVPRNAVGDDNQDGLGPDTYSAHQGGGAISFDSEGNLYLGTGDDVDPFGDSGNYAPLDQRFPERYDARNTSANTNDLRGKILRIRPLPDAAGEPGAGATYSIPEGNMFAPGTAQTRPEIYAMGFRNPFTVQADPASPGTVVVGEYGPDASGDNASRGPAGVIEWNRVSEPGFHGWPLCVGDNSDALSYNRYEFPSGPSGPRYDCSADEIPNDSPNNTGMANIPGPAAGADVWAKSGGGTPARFGIPGGATEATTGPVYDFDPDNPSETKWPAYFDGAWLIFNRAANWWREVRVRDDGSGILRVNGFFPANQFGNPPHNYVIPTRFGPDGSLYLVTWSGGCCRSGLPGLGAGQLMRIDFVGEQDDVTPPVVDAEVSGSKVGENYVNRATLVLDATDASGIASIEYSVNGGEWTEYSDPVVFDEAGDYEVTYRATDNSANGNVSEVGMISISVVIDPSCTPVRSDEFGGSGIDVGRWTYRHPTTPADGTGAPSVAGGELVLPLGAYSLDLTRPGPVALLGQELPDSDFEMTAEISAPGLNTSDGGAGSAYAQVGFKIFRTDDDWIKIAHTRNADGGASAQTYFEMATEVGGTRALGPRIGLAAAATNLPTWWIRVTRTGDIINAHYSLTDPESGANWVDMGLSPNLEAVLPEAGGPRYIAAYGGNGDTTATFDYIRFEPDELIGCDGEPPATTATLNGGAPGAEYDEPVQVELTADDGDGSGVDYTEYSVDGGAWTGYESPFEVSGLGEHEVQYRSADLAGNVEETRSVSFTINEPPPGGEAQLALGVRPKRKAVKPGRTAAFTANARNVGTANAANVRVCLAKGKLRAKIIGGRCRSTTVLAPGATSSARFKLRPKRAARGKTLRLSFTASSPDAPSAAASARLKVKRR